MKVSEYEKVFKHPITVQHGDIDELNHVNNVVYLRWVQEAAAAHWNAITTQSLKEKYSWVVLRHEIDYRNAAYLGDELIAHTWVGSCDGPRSERHVKLYQVKTGKLVAETKTYWCLLDAQTKKPKRIESEIASLFLSN